MAASFPNSFTQSPFFHQISKNPSVKKPSSLHFRKQNLVVSASASATAEMAVSSSSFYDVLGIPTNANFHEIKSAYRKLARTCHPDVVAINMKKSSVNEFIKIQTAYTTLSDPGRRADYDREMIYRNHLHSNLSSRRSVTMPPVTGYMSRNWESDQCW